MDTTAIKPLTTPGTRADDLSAQDYRDIYDELREHLSLAEFVVRIGSQVSRSWWSQYESGGKSLSWARRNELRVGAGLPELASPPSVALADVSGDATVWRVGEGPANRVIMVTPDAPNGLILSVNGDVHIISPVAAPHAREDPVTPVTSEATPARPRRPRPQACTLPILKETRALYATIKGDGETWDDLLHRIWFVLGFSFQVIDEAESKRLLLTESCDVISSNYDTHGAV